MPSPDPLAALHPDRLPPMLPVGVLAEFCAALALGLALAWAVGLAARLVARRAPSRRTRARRALAAARALPPGERALAQARLLAEAADDLDLGRAELARRLGVDPGALYRPGAPDLEAPAARAIGWMRG